MSEARRAMPGPPVPPRSGGRRAVLIVGAVALAILAGFGVGLAARQMGIGAAPGAPVAASTPEQHDPASHEPAPPGQEPPSLGPASPEPTSASSPSVSAPSADQLSACVARVAAGDRVISEARTGVGHWSEHVQAQTDVNSDKIDTDQMDAIFKRTREAGPDDLRRYDDAKKELSGTDGDCGGSADASAAETKRMDQCQQRLDAQAQPMQRAEAAMKDWRRHQADMARSRHEHNPDAAEIWRKAWGAAPPNINAFDDAIAGYEKAPACK